MVNENSETKNSNYEISKITEPPKSRKVIKKKNSCAQGKQYYFLGLQGLRKKKKTEQSKKHYIS